MTQWAIVNCGNPVDVMPLDDLREHEVGEGCWCCPTEDDDVLIHHSMDRRELYERGELDLH